MKTPSWFIDAPIRRKFIFIVFFVTFAATLFAILLMTAIEWFMLRDELAKSVSAQVSVIASISASQLAANDREAAEKTVGVLSNIDNIEFAGILDKNGEAFALYVRPGFVMPPHQHQAADGERRNHTASYIEVVVPVLLKREQIGLIHVRSSMTPVYEKLKWNTAVTVAAAAGAFLAAVLLLLRLLPAITDPLQYLAALMGSVSRDNNFSLRAALHGNDETGMLAKGFNAMLAQIQTRDGELAQQRHFLEEEISKRTADLLATNEQLSILLNSLPVAVYRCQAGGDFAVMYMSQNVVSFTGYNAEDFIADHDLWFQRIHPEDASMVYDEMATLFEKGAHAYEYRWLTSDGTYIWIQDSLKVIRTDDGTPQYMVGMWQNITGYKLAEEKIRKQQELTTKIIETIPMRVFWKDRDLHYLGCNTLFAKDAGLSRPDELIGKSDFDLSWKDQAELYGEDDRQVMESDTPKLSYDEPQTTPDGGQIWLRTSKVPLHNEFNETIGILGVYEDITDYKQAEQALEESERKFRAILDSAVDGFLMADAQTHKFVSANRAICDMLGYRPEELYRLGLEDIHPAESLDDVRQQFERQLKGEIRIALNLPVKRKDGSVFFADVSSAPLLLAQKHYLVGIFHDVTERSKAEEKIRKLNEELEAKVKERTQQLLNAQEELVRKEKLALLGQVVGSVGHELRNPLGVMSNAVYYLQAVLPDADESVREYLDIIKNEIDDSERIVSDLLDSVRTKTPQPEDVVLSKLIEQTLSKLTIPSSVTVKLEIPATLPPLYVDALQIHQVLRNLISNAMEAMPEGGVLEISAAENREGGTVALSVHDSGTGIKPEQLDKLFQPLFTTKARGIGLGLMVVKNLTQANGGTVTVKSKANRGTTFTVTLPTDNLSSREV